MFSYNDLVKFKETGEIGRVTESSNMEVTMETSNCTFCGLPEDFELIQESGSSVKCPYCGEFLESLGRFSSTPCHFSYSDDAPEYIDGEQFKCNNEQCDEEGTLFYTDDEHPGELYQGSPDTK